MRDLESESSLGALITIAFYARAAQTYSIAMTDNAAERPIRHIILTRVSRPHVCQFTLPNNLKVATSVINRATLFQALSPSCLPQATIRAVRRKSRVSSGNGKHFRRRNQVFEFTATIVYRDAMEYPLWDRGGYVQCTLPYPLQAKSGYAGLTRSPQGRASNLPSRANFR